MNEIEKKAIAVSDMPRYIDADALITRLGKLENEYEYADGDFENYEFVYGTLTGVRQSISYTKSQPTVDVEPRAEVAREIFEEIEREITDALESNYEVLPQVEESEALWNNVNGKINALRGIGYFIAELKEKYMEEKK